MDATGTGVVAWVDDGAVRATLRPPGSVFGVTATLAPDGSGVPAVALDGAGRALVAYARGGSLGLAERTPGATTFTPIANAIAGVQGDPDVTFTGAGSAIVVWAGTDGAIHALSYSPGGGVAALPDLSTGVGNAAPRLGGSNGLATAAWLATETTPDQVSTHVQAAVRPPGSAFGAPEDLASAAVVQQNQMWSGAQVSLAKVAVSDGGATDALLGEVVFHGPPGDVALESHVAVRLPAMGWTSPQRVGFADAPPQGGALTQDVVGGRGADALYVGGEKTPGSATMTFSVRARSGRAGSYGEPVTLMTGAPGDVLAAALASNRFLVLMRTANALYSRAGGASGFDAALRFTGTDAGRLLGMDGMAGGLAVAAWVTTAGSVAAAVYDDALAPGSLPPTAGRDTAAPILSRLAVSPRRFAVRRSKHGAHATAKLAHGTRIRWRLSEPARVVLRVDRVRGGFRHGSRCEAKRPGSGRARPCTRFVRVGSLRHTAPAGVTSLPFNGFVKRRALRRGSYRLTAIATDAARHTAKAKRARFIVVRG